MYRPSSGVGFSPDELASLQALDQVRQPGQRGDGDLGEFAHPHGVVRILRQPGQGVILDEAEPGVALQLALQCPAQLNRRRGEGPPGALLLVVQPAGRFGCRSMGAGAGHAHNLPLT